MTTQPKLFFPITKVDAVTRTVYGYATAEEMDRSGEICDYESTKPLYEAWSSEFSKATDGKSLGNLRSMHNNVAAGKLTSISFDDDNKAIGIAAKVVDDAEWEKVVEGVYTGFSQGGNYVKRWKDDAGDQRYTAEPVEVSLVDYPCVPSATFQMIKAAGAEPEVRHFKSVIKEAAAAPTNDEVAAMARVLAKAATGAETTWASYIEPAREKLVLAKAEQQAGDETKEAPEVKEPVDKEAKVEEPEAELEQVWKAADGQTFKKKADAIAHNASLVPAAPESELAKASNALAVLLTKKEFTADERKKFADSGIAMKDGGHPIPDKAALKDAVSAFGSAKNQSAVKRHIIKRAKALGETDELPADWPGSTKDAEKVAAAAALAKTAKDGIKKYIDAYGLTNLISILACVESAEECLEMDTFWGVGINASDDLKTRFGQVLMDLGDVCAEALDAYLEGISEEETSEAVARAAASGALAKAGARHSRTDKATLQTAHDALVKLGADCGMDKTAEAGTLAKRTTDAEARVAALSADVASAIKQMAAASEELQKRGTLIDDLKKDVALLKAQPVAGRPSVHLTVLPDTGEGLEKAEAAAKAGDTEGVIDALIKNSQTRPITGMPGRVMPPPDFRPSAAAAKVVEQVPAKVKAEAPAA